MTNRNRLIVYGLAAALVLSGFLFGRMTSSDRAEAFNSGGAAVAASPTPATAPEAEASAFYLSDYKTGYSDGFEAGTTGQGNGLATTTREGYNEGFKQGFADGYQAVVAANTSAPVAARSGVQPVAYRSAARQRPVFVERKRNSTLKNVLTIAAPAAIGAGVGGAVGGRKGAGVGALLGGGGGALYHLIKNK
ncbi:MAG: hypothetical protein KF868_22630 [Acidobacteria bacterium]|nr:hypothetical protein [Acidobacteriota bacterium]